MGGGVFHLIDTLIELLNGRPVPFFLRTGPEGAAKRFRKAELRDNLLVLVFQRHNLGTLCGIDSHGDVARLNLTTALLGKGIIGLQKTSSTVLGKQTRTHREY